MKYTQSLNGIWQLRRTDWQSDLPARVPGSCMETFLEQGLIPDPYYRENETVVKAIFEHDYLYSHCFTVSEEMRNAQRLELVFEGLDTLAEVTLNGQQILSADNMHRTWRIPVKQIVTDGENRLTVLLRSPSQYIAKRIAAADVNFPAGGSMAGNNYLRKAHSMFGWDWGPQLPDCGIWRDVYLEAASGPVLRDVYPRQHHENGAVTVTVQVDIDHLPDNGNYRLQAVLTAPDGKRYQTLCPAARHNAPQIHIDDPQLWWPNGLGDHPLYQLEVALLHADTRIDSAALRIGLRTLELLQEVDEDGKGAQFAFSVNGCPFFATGSNYIPEDNFLSRITPERSRKLVADCAWANYNMIRVWGGGYYPSDAFFDACDEYGICVWQDLMFACNVYELDDRFEETTTAEVADNVRRIRHHASLALWCGNNEIEWGWQEWFPILTPSVARRNDYTVMFEYLYKKIVNRYDPDTPYKASSPSSNYQMIGFQTTNDHLPNSFHAGDTHFYDVWLNRAPMEEYRKHRFRFLSEFSFQSLPCLKTLRSVMEEEDLNLNSPVMDFRQKSDRGNALILHYLTAHYRYPKDFPSLVYVTQLMQAYAVPYAIEHMRRNRPYSMGTLYWQLNDIWPGISWSSIDYYGRYKALHYAVRRVHAPFTASILDEGPRMRVYVENETRQEKQYRLVCAVKDMHNRVLCEKQLTGKIAAFNVDCAFDADFEAWIQGREKSCYFTYSLYEEEQLVATDAAFFVKHKHLALPECAIHADVTETEDAFAICISSEELACYVRLELTGQDAVFSDNFFCLTGEPRHIYALKKDLSAPMTLEQFRAELTLTSLRDTY